MNNNEKFIYSDGEPTNYTISKDGIVRKYLPNGESHIINSTKNKDGYHIVRLYINGITNTFFIHRLVAYMFIPNPENKTEVNHITMNKDDNSVENLEWVTAQENSSHRSENRVINGTNAKELVQSICLDLENKSLTVKQIAEKFGVSETFIKNIIKGHSWKNISSEYDFRFRLNNMRTFSSRTLDTVMESEYDDEVWVPIYVNNILTTYDVSNKGNIRNHGKLHKCVLNKASNSVIINLVVNDKRYRVRLRRLVAEAFIPNSDPEKNEVININGDPMDNRVENLKWVSSSERMKNTYDSNSRKRKYTHEQLFEAFSLFYTKAMAVDDIAERTGVAKSTIYDISRGKSYTDIYKEVTNQDKDSICKNDKLDIIKKLVKEGQSDDEIVKYIKNRYITSNEQNIRQKITDIRKVIGKEVLLDELSDNIYLDGIDLHIRVSKAGLVINSITNKRVNVFRTTGGYPYIEIFSPELNRQVVLFVHDLIARSFLPNDNPEENTVVGTKNHNATDIYLDNLVWMTPTEWAKVMPPLENDIVINETLVKQICIDLVNSPELSLKEIALKHQVPLHVVTRIYYKEQWSNITKNYDFSIRQKSTIKRTGQAIVTAALMSGYKTKYISRIYGINKAYIKKRKSVLRAHSLLI